jgi:hypothetical protein
MSNQKSMPVNAAALLQEAQIAVGERIDTTSGSIHELSPSHCRGQKTLVFERKEGGITVAVRVDLPETSVLRNQSLTSSEALTLLGALTLALQQHEAEAKLIAGSQGLEAVMVSARLCDRQLEATALNDHVSRVQDIAQSLEPALAEESPVLVESILERVRPVFAAPTKEIVRDQPIIVPTFDEEARNRMMQQSR